MKIQQKGFVGFLFIIAVALIGVGSYFYLRHQPASQVISSNQTTNKTNYIVKLNPADAAKVASDVAKCNAKADYPYGDECIKYGALTDQNPSMCLAIKDGYIKDECYSDFANLTKDISFCSRINMSSFRSDCLFAIGNVGKSGYHVITTGFANPQVCEPNVLKKQPQNQQDACYQEFAMGYKDISICQNIADQRQRAVCQDDVSHLGQ